MDAIDRLTRQDRFVLVHHQPRHCALTEEMLPNFTIVSDHADGGSAEAALAARDTTDLDGFLHVHAPA